jgi:hypothetical protein
MLLRCGERQTKENRPGRSISTVLCDDIVVVVVWAAPLWWWWRSCRLGGSRQYAPNPTTTTFLHMHLAKKLFCLSLSLSHSIFLFVNPPPPLRPDTSVEPQHYGITISFSRVENGTSLMFVCLLYGRTLSTKKPLDPHSAFFFLYTVYMLYR